MGRRPRASTLHRSRLGSTALLAAIALLLIAVLAGTADTADAASPSELRKFKSRVMGDFKGQALADGVSVPTGAGFGDTIIVAHKCDVSFLNVGGTASAGLKALAETGSTSAFEMEVTAAVAAGTAQGSWKINPPNGPTNGKGGPDLQIEEEFSCLTILVKLNPSSDWFAGVSAYDLRSGGTWPTPDANNNIFIELFPFDAGTLDGSDFAASTTATSPPDPITSLRNSGKFSNNKIARLKLQLKDPALTKDVEVEEAIESIIVTWGEVAAAGGYHVMWKSGAEVHDLDGSAGRRDVVVGGKTRTHTITGLTGGVEYNVQVVAYNEAGQSSREPTTESHAYATPISAATADNTVLVGNATQLFPSTERLAMGSQFRVRAQAFTTGSESAFLGSVTLPEFRKQTNNAKVDVHIYSASGIDPGGKLHTLTRPDFSSLGSGSNSSLTFNAAAGEPITLAANTTYFVYAELIQGEVSLLHTKDDDEDPDSDEGWSIADRCRAIYAGTLSTTACASSSGGFTAALVMVLNSPLEAGKPLLSISGSKAVEGAGVQFTVSLSSALSDAVTVEYSTADDSATTADSDYTAVSNATLTFAANETEKTVTIDTTDDSVDEDDETFNVELSSPSENAQLGYVSSASGLIINNDQTTQTDGTLSSITLTGSDGNTIALTPTFNTYSFLYTATADSEIDSLTGVVTPSTSGTVESILYVGGDEDTNTTAHDAVWPLVPGDNLVKFMVTSPDGNRTKIYKIHVDKAASTDATLSALTFVDNTGTAITLSPAFNSATTEYTASVGAAVTGVTLTGTENHSGATTSNNQGPDLMSGEATVGLWAGEIDIEIDVTAEDGVTTKRYTVTAERTLEISFGSATYSVDEGDMVEVSVLLNGAPGDLVSADLPTMLQGGALAADFRGVPNSITFMESEVSKTFSFVARADAADDAGESVKIGLGGLTAGLVKGTTDETVVSITNVESTQLVAVNFGQSTYSVDEGSTVSITVTLGAAPTSSVMIPLTITVQGGATTADYDVPTSVTFASGETSKTITFSATLDSLSDAGESVKIELGTLPAGYTVGATVETTVSIRNVAATVNFGDASYDVDEGEDVTVTVTLSPSLGSAVTIQLTTTRQGGATTADYSLSATSVTFAAGETEKTFDFTATEDTVDDDDESVTIGFGTPAGVVAGSTSATTVSIEDDDHPTIKVGFQPPPEGGYSVAEGAFIDLTLKLTAAPGRNIQIRMQAFPMGGATSLDFSIAPIWVPFTANQTEATVTFTAKDDDDNDDGEYVKLEPDLALPSGVGLGDHFFTNVTIDDTDVPAVTVSFERATYVVDEGESVDVKVKLSADPERTVVIPISRSEANIGSGDYSGVPTSLTFNSGDTEKIISFIATEDTENDDGESLLLGFGPLPLPAGVSLGTYSQSTVSITDDDVPAVTVSFENATYSVAEGGSITVKVKLSADPERTVTIPINATAQLVGSSAVYTVPTNVTFASGEKSKTITFSSTQDDTDNDGESVKLTFGMMPDDQVSASGTTETVVSIDDDEVTAVTVSFEKASYTVVESDNPDTLDVEEHKVTVKVSLSADPKRQVVIPIGELFLDGLTAGDYSGVPGNVTFESSDTEMSFTFTALHDTVDDDDEQLRLTLGPLPTGVTGAAPYSAVFSITDDDDPQVVVSISSSVTMVDEGGTATVTVSLDKDPEREVIVLLTPTDLGGASAMDDYSGIPEDVTFPDGGATTQSFTFQASDDDVDDDGEGVMIGFGTLPARVSAGTSNEVTLSIEDNDVPEVTVSFEKAAYAVGEGSSVIVKVKLSADPERNLTIPLSPMDQDGASAADYTGIPANVSFSSGDDEKTFTVMATQDSIDDDDESVEITFDTDNLPDRVAAGITDETTISITDDDFPTLNVSFESATYTAAEGSSETIKVKLNAAPERQVTIPFTITSDTAVSTDYSTPSSVTFESNDMEKTFTFTAEHDSTDDDDERVTIAFSSSLPTGITAGGTPETVVSITDDDVPNVTVKFDESTYDAPEGGDITVTVVLSEAPERQVTIPLTATPNGATVGDDYTAVAQSVTFGATDTSQSITFTAANDNVSDDGEYVTIGFDTLPTGVTAGTPGEATVTIIDNIIDVVAAFEHATYTVAEGAIATITVTLDKDPERMVSIPLTATPNGGATEEDDYSHFPASVSFASGEMSKDFTFTVDSDEVDDDDESLVVGFDTLPTGVTAGTIAETTVNLTDDDFPAVTVSFEKASYTVVESDDPETLDVEEHKVTVTVLLSADPERPVTVPLTATGQDGATDPADPPDPTDPADYTTPDDVTFGPGEISKTYEISKTFELTAAGDDVDDDGESVKIGFGSPLPTGITAGGTPETVVSITDDDHPPVKVSFSHAMHTVAEGAAVALTVSLDVDPERELVIELEPTFDGVNNGATRADYTGVPDRVTLSTDKRSETITFMAVQDSEDDDEDQVTIGIVPNPDERVSAGDVPSTTISITDDDDPQVTVKFGAAMYTVLEGGSASVTVILSADPERTVTIPLTKDPMNGLSDGDYDGVPTNVEFVSGQTEAPFTVTASADEEDDDDESVVVSFGELPAGVTAPDAVSTDASETTIAIVDGNVPDVMVKIEASSQTVAEGASVTVTVTLDQAPERAVTIPLTTTPIGTYSADDLDVDMGDPLPTSVEFLEDELSKSFTIRAKDDDIDDDDEGLKIGLGTLPSKVSAGSPSEVTVNITDNDDPQVSVSFAKAAYSVAEGSQQAIMVKLSADPEREITLEFTYTEGDGADAGDYSVDPDPVLLVFNPGDTENSFTFKAAADDDDDDGETVEIGFTTPLPTGVTLASSGSETVVTIEPVQTILIGGGGGGGGGGGPSPSEADFEWTVKHDIDQLDTTNDWPTDVWSDGKTLWVAENGPGADDGVYAYDLTTGERVEEYEFPLAETNRAPRGLWSDGTMAWVADSGRNRLFAYDLATGERVEALEIVLADRNRDARAIWSDGTIMWVLDGVKDSLFAYDLATRELLGEYFLDSGNDDPRGLWSDGIVYCVSDDAAKRVFAYRMPASEGETALERVRDEEFDKLSRASNNSPRGIWSDGDVLYVADANDDRIYTYNMPARVDASLALLSLAGVNIGDFHGRKTRYEGTPRGGVTETTVDAVAKQSGATVVIGPADADPVAEGHQVALAEATEITVTVTSPDDSRTRVYRVALGSGSVELGLESGFNKVEWPGADGAVVVDALSDITNRVAVVYAWDEAAETWLIYIPDLLEVPGLNTLTALEQGHTYWIAATEPVTWTIQTGAPARR